MRRLAPLVALALPALALAQSGLLSQTDSLSTPYHEAHVGQIVFLSKSMGSSSVNDSVVLSSVTYGEPLYFRAFFTDSTNNSLYKTGQLDEVSNSALSAKSRWKFEFYVDDELLCTKYNDASYLRADEKNRWITARGTITMASNDRDKFAAGAEEWRQCLPVLDSALSVGAHQLRLDISAYTDSPKEVTSEVMASGSVELKIAKPLFDPNDPKVCLPKAAASEPALEATMMEEFKKKGWEEVPQSLRITTASWAIERHPITNEPVSRSRDAAIAMTLGEECRYHTSSFTQDYNGSSYGSTYLDGIGSKRTVPCSCLQ